MKLGKRLCHAGVLLVFFVAVALLVQAFGGVYVGTRQRKAAEEETGASYHIRVTYPVEQGVTVLDDLPEIEAAVNEITVEEIDVEVELVAEDMQESGTDYLLWLSRGDTLDLMLVQRQDVMSFVDKSLVQPLSGYLKRSAPELFSSEAYREGKLSRGAIQQGRTYGIANGDAGEADGFGLWISAARLEQCGFSYQENHIYSLEEIEELLALLKKVYPDSYPLGQITAKQKGSVLPFYGMMGDALGADMMTGIVRGESDVVEDVFTTGEYYRFLQYMNRWYQKEYLYPDGVIYDDSVLALLLQELILMVPASSRPGTMNAMFGQSTDYVCLKTTEVRQDSYDGASYWMLPSTSRYPQAAIRFLNLLYQDARISRLLNYGICGRHYTITDDARGCIMPVCGKDKKPKGFYNPSANLGAAAHLYHIGGKKEAEALEAYGRNAVAGSSRYEGFSYDTSEMSRQLDELQNVVSRYAPVLESGSVDLESNYMQFLVQLREAGAEKVRADKQRQLTNWLSRQSR